jgi:carboxylesterase type B
MADPPRSRSPSYVESTLTTMQSDWRTFVAKGTPSECHVPAWPAYTSATDRHVVLKTRFQVGSGLESLFALPYLGVWQARHWPLLWQT